MEQKKNWYQNHRKELMAYLCVLAFMISVMVIPSGRLVHSAETDLDMQVNTTLAESLDNYAGIFSVTVTASVNPSATLAVLAIVGTIENADVYAPDSEWMNKAEQTLRGIPIVEQAGDLPIANPTAAVILSIIAIVMIVLHSIAETKVISKASIDNVEQWGGFIVTAALSLLPLATTQVVSAAQTEIHYVTGGTYAITLIVAILSTIFNAIVYICIYNCIDAVGLICAVIPVKGVNIVEEALKAVLHIILILLQIYARPLSIACSVIIAIIGIILFRKVSAVSDYYTYIYVKPVWNSIFHHGEKVPLLHRKFPRKGEKAYPGMNFAIPVFTMNKLKDLKLRKRELGWLIMKDDEPYLARIKSFRKIQEVPLTSLNLRNDIIYLQKNMRFMRIMTEDKQIELILSNEYTNQWEELLSRLHLTDYQIVRDQKKEDKKAARDEWMERWLGFTFGSNKKRLEDTNQV